MITTSPRLLFHTHSPVPTHIMTLSLLPVLRVPVPSCLKLPSDSAELLILFHRSLYFLFSAVVSLSTLISIWPGTSAVAQWLKLHLQCTSFRRLGFRSLAQEDPLEKGMATHSSVPAWRIPWTEEPGRLWSTGLQRVRHDWSDSACMHVIKAHTGINIS